MDKESRLLFVCLRIYCRLETQDKSKLQSRYHEFLRQIFSADSILQLVCVDAIAPLTAYATTGAFPERLAALVPGLGMIIRNLQQDSPDKELIQPVLRPLCGLLARRAFDTFEQMKSRRETIISPPLLDSEIRDPEPWEETGCWYGKPAYRPRPFYEGRDVDRGVNVDDEGTCRKLYATYSNQSLTGGLMALWCPHLVCLGFHKMPRAEGRNDVFSALFKYWKTPPQVVIYDFACQLQPYCMTREPEFFKNTLFAIDEMHAKGHSSCSQACFVSNYMRVRGSIRNLNSSAAECSNSGLSRIRKSVSYMDQKHAICFTYVYLCIWNRKRERLMLNEANKRLQLLI